MNDKGFTLIELVMVIVLIGILAVFAAPRLPGITTTNANAFTDKLRADMRYAQNTAMTSNLRSRVYFNGTGTAPAAGYEVLSSATSTCNAFTAVTNPAGEGTLSITLNTGIYAGITVTPSSGCLEYDSLGRPFDCSGNLGICSDAASGLTVTINAAGSAAANITVTDQTGAVN